MTQVCQYQLGDTACLPCPCNDTVQHPNQPSNVTWTVELEPRYAVDHVVSSGPQPFKLTLNNLTMESSGRYHLVGYFPNVGSGLKCPMWTCVLEVMYSFCESACTVYINRQSIFAEGGLQNANDRFLHFLNGKRRAFNRCFAILEFRDESMWTLQNCVSAVDVLQLLI